VRTVQWLENGRRKEPMNVILILCDTLRRDHCGPYNGGGPLSEAGSTEQPGWTVPTPNMVRLAERGTLFTNCYAGSTPCIPARRDLYTGCYDFLRRGWAPLEDEDPDLPGQLSPRPTKPIGQYREGEHVSYLVTDHLCLWTNGAGNYHMNFTGFDFIRGNQEDPWTTAPVPFEAPEADRATKLERYFRNKHFLGNREGDSCAARVFTRAAEWLERNHTHRDFFLHIDSYDPHEPWDPPEELVRWFDPKGYSVRGWAAHPPYAPWRGNMNEEQFQSFRARYAAKVVLTDRWLGRFLDTLDRLGAWKDTTVIFTADHGTFNGDHGRMGKLQTHEFGCKSHIPLIICHPDWGHGERRDQLVQLVDIYATVLSLMGKPVPRDRDGVDLTPLLLDPKSRTRDHAIMGQFGYSVSITDGRWILHQAPDVAKPLYWYSHHLSRFFDVELGPYADGRRQTMRLDPPPGEEYRTTWLSDLTEDPGELVNRAENCPEKLAQMRAALKEKLAECGAPAELENRLGLQGG
jgi:arylsulfatase A-like enzyme